MNTSSACHVLQTFVCCLPGHRVLNQVKFTFVLGRGIASRVELGVGILSVLDIVLFVVLPAQSKGFAPWSTPWMFIEAVHIVSVRCWFFFGVSEHDCGNWFLVSFSESTTFRCERGWNLWLEDIAVIRRTVFETIVLGETVFVSSVSPGASWLMPLGPFFGHGDVGITEKDRRIGSMLFVEVSRMGLIAAHVMSRNHTLILFHPVFTWHLNKFNQVIISRKTHFQIHNVKSEALLFKFIF